MYDSAAALQSLTEQFARSSVAAPQPQAPVLRWVGTSLGIAGVPLLIGEGELDEIIETPEVTPIPGCQHWVMGVAAHRGGLLPIISGDGLFNQQPYLGRDRDYCAVLRQPGANLGITLSSVQRHLLFPAEDRDMEHPVPAAFEPYSLGGFHHEGQFLAVLDVESLIADHELLNAARTPTTSSKGESL